MKLNQIEPELFGGFYAGKKILITGGGGVKGTWLTLAAEALGANVTVLDIKRPDPDSNFVLSGLRQRVRFVQGDVCDFDLVRKLVAEQDLVFHLAAKVLVYDCRANPYEAYKCNTLGVATLAEAFRLSPPCCSRCVFITTDKVYAPKAGLWDETDPLFASGPYPVSKAAAEKIIEDYRTYFDSAGKLFGVGRAGNVIIGGDLYSSRKTSGAGRVFVDCYDALIEGKSPEIFSPSFTRPYTYGLDILTGYMSLMARLDEPEVRGQAFNFGPNEQGVTNALLATKICELWSTGIMWHGGKLRPEPFVTQALNWDKARQRLGWLPAFTLFETLIDSTAWYREWSKVRTTPTEGALSAFNANLLLKHYQAARNLGVWWASSEAPPAPST